MSWHMTGEGGGDEEWSGKGETRKTELAAADEAGKAISFLTYTDTGQGTFQKALPSQHWKTTCMSISLTVVLFGVSMNGLLTVMKWRVRRRRM